ncbi:MAG TPA: chaperone modulator CbpM [Chitinophagaceae bacterium]|nr:chaperone modulator CbpM [Chitinophagaceae bacterium]
METDMIMLNEFCASHQIEISFVQSLEEYGLVKTVVVDQSLCVNASDLLRLERVVRLHQELNINPEGLDVIDHLLKRMEDMQHEITELKNRLNFYHEEDS